MCVSCVVCERGAQALHRCRACMQQLPAVCGAAVRPQLATRSAHEVCRCIQRGLVRCRAQQRLGAATPAARMHAPASMHRRAHALRRVARPPPHLAHQAGRHGCTVTPHRRSGAPGLRGAGMARVALAKRDRGRSGGLSTAVKDITNARNPLVGRHWPRGLSLGRSSLPAAQIALGRALRRWACRSTTTSIRPTT